jgi:DNA-binding response OmpR family regulator
METAMNQEKTKRLAQLATQLTEILMTAAICAKEIRATIIAELDGDGIVRRGRVSIDPHGVSAERNHRPIVDHSTLSLSWAGKTCHLGYTVLFRLADRLSRRPNQYITSEQLLHDVWNGDLRSPDTIRSAIRNLRQRLSDAGMGALADSIQGRSGRYGLILCDGA